MSAVNFEAKYELSSPHLFILPKNDLLNSTVRPSKRDDVVLQVFFFSFLVVSFWTTMQEN